jgi:hypothetical protein
MNTVFVTSETLPTCALLLEELHRRGAKVCPIVAGVIAPSDAVSLLQDPDMKEGFRIMKYPPPNEDLSLISSWATLTPHRVAIAPETTEEEIVAIADALMSHCWPILA